MDSALSRPARSPRAGPGASANRATAVGLLLVVVAAAWLRWRLVDQTNLDLVDHFLPWLDDIRTRGLWVSVAQPYSRYGYTPFYSYAIGLANALLPAGTDGPIVVKSVSFFFDGFAAIWLVAIARLRWADPRVALVAAAALLFAPTVVLNSAVWGQSDIVYASFLLAMVYALLKRSPGWAMLAFGTAVSIKLQAAWLGPFLLMMTLRRSVPWWTWLSVPLVYAVLALPPWWLGRPASELATIYLTQAGTQQMLNYSAASLHFFSHYLLTHLGWGPQWVPLMAKFSIVGTAVVALVFAVKVTRDAVTPERLLLAALASALLMPLCLPHMHNRYFFAADLLALALAVWRPAYWPVAVGMQVSSALTYISFLWGRWLLSLPVPPALAALGVSNNLQPVTGLEALATLGNLGLLVWCWRRLQAPLVQARNGAHARLPEHHTAALPAVPS